MLYQEANHLWRTLLFPRQDVILIGFKGRKKKFCISMSLLILINIIIRTLAQSVILIPHMNEIILLSYFSVCNNILIVLFQILQTSAHRKKRERKKLENDNVARKSTKGNIIYFHFLLVLKEIFSIHILQPLQNVFSCFSIRFLNCQKQIL